RVARILLKKESSAAPRGTVDLRLRLKTEAAPTSTAAAARISPQTGTALTLWIKFISQVARLSLEDRTRSPKATAERPQWVESGRDVGQDGTPRSDPGFKKSSRSSFRLRHFSTKPSADGMSARKRSNSEWLSR